MRMFVDRLDAGRRLGARVARWWVEEHSGDGVRGRNADGGDGAGGSLGGAVAAGDGAAGDGDGDSGVSDGDGAGLVVLGLPRGGIPVAAEVAAALADRGVDAPLDVLLVRKVGAPGRPELAMAAVSEGGVVVTNPDVLAYAAVSPDEFTEAVRREQAVLAQRAQRYRAVRVPVAIAGRVALIVDDGIATGATARAACAVARARGARLVVLAAPVVAPSTAAGMMETGRTPDGPSGIGAMRGSAAPGRGPGADVLLTLLAPESFTAVGQFYADFAPTTDREVERILRAQQR